MCIHVLRFTVRKSSACIHVNRREVVNEKVWSDDCWSQHVRSRRGLCWNYIIFINWIITYGIERVTTLLSVYMHGLDWYIVAMQIVCAIVVETGMALKTHVNTCLALDIKNSEERHKSGTLKELVASEHQCFPKDLHIFHT